MSFAPTYTPTTSFAQDESNQASGRATVKTASVDVELANIATSHNELNANVKKLQRDDDKLRDLLVEPYALSEQTRAMMAAGGKVPKGAWLANTNYALSDLVQFQAVAYMCQTAHNSGPSFNVGFWLTISGDGSSASSAQQSAASAATASAAAAASATSAINADSAADAAMLSANGAADSELAAQNAANSIAGLTPVNLSAYMLDLLANNSAASTRTDLGAASAVSVAGVSVKDFGALCNGVTDDTAAVAAAVAEALSRNVGVIWSGGSALTSASIADFHSVRHYGYGAVIRGTDTFYISPTGSQTNTIYTSTSGSVFSDGLSAAQPRRTLQAAIDALSNWQLMGGGWKIKMAAGTYARARTPDAGLRSLKPIEIEGPAVGGHPNVPTALVKEGATQASTGLVVFDTNLVLRDIKFEDYNGTSAAAGVSGSRSLIYTENVHFTDCYYGFSNGGAPAVVNVKGGIFDDCGYLNSVTSGGAAIRGLFHPKCEIGAQDAGTLAGGPIIRNCSLGIRLQEGGTGHCDFVTFEDCGVGIRFPTGARLNLDGSSFKRCGTAIYITSGSYADTTPNTVFGTGADANGRNIVVGQGSLVASGVIDGQALGNAVDIHCFSTTYPAAVYTSISSVNTVESFLLKAGQFGGVAYSANPSRKIRCIVHGTLAGTTGTYKRVALRLGSAAIALLSFAGSTVGNFRAELEWSFISSSVQHYSAIGTAAGVVPSLSQGAGAVGMSVDQTIALQAYVENAADSITVNAIEWFVQGV
ncbi:hypothetical protein [Methylibium sp.]|uniref:hypothetical protein n=1 Tax=Methylibium sp. TaxID=2067992 RepID=UPI00181866AF|nr:hypothetical protein [Methylibium sp.]MBA3588213.1 hypothetical protein [Methylibium sp.]